MIIGIRVKIRIRQNIHIGYKFKDNQIVRDIKEEGIKMHVYQIIS